MMQPFSNEKKYNLNAPITLVRDSLYNIYVRYGERSHKAEQNEGIDWKAVSHAVRASDQLIELYTSGKITYPLYFAEHILNIKQGKLPYKEVSDEIEYKMEQINQLANDSNLPETPDYKFWDAFVLTAMQQWCYWLYQ